MKKDSMPRSRFFFLRLLLPLLLLVSVLGLMALAALSYMKAQHGEALAQQRRDIAVLNEAIDISLAMADIQRRVSDVLAQAAAGKLNEAAVYRAHAAVVDELAHMARRVRALIDLPAFGELVAQEGSGLRHEFDEYRNYVVMSTDLAAIEPLIAGRHITQARTHYDDFYLRVMGIVHTLSEHVEATGLTSIGASEVLTQRMATMLALGFIAAFALSMFAAKAMARRLEAVAQALILLAESKGVPPPLPTVAHMQETERNELGHLAGVVLALRQTVQDRYQSGLKLIEYQHVLERTIDQLTVSQRHEREWHHLAFHDGLTGLPNRRLMLEVLGKAIKTCKRNGRKLALLFIDLNRFKQLNDTHGHGAGDLLLQEVARRLRKTVRDCDTVARLGGDEFLVLLEDLPADQALAAEMANVVVGKLHTALSEEYLLGDLHYTLSASVGVSFSLEGEPDEMIRAADEAMYASKRAPRDEQ